MQRHCASLEGGVEGFVSRRSRKMRANLRRARRKTQAAGVTFEEADLTRGSKEIYDRIIEIEMQSWKGLSGVGIDSGHMHDFYDEMVARLHAADALRVLFAREGGRDAAYILGGVLGDTFRGLQFSYIQELEELSLGNICQLEMVDRLVTEGVLNYDLGSDIEYKARWGESGLKTTTLVVFK